LKLIEQGHASVARKEPTINIVIRYIGWVIGNSRRRGRTRRRRSRGRSRIVAREQQH
jgi:hypothetical protein